MTARTVQAAVVSLVLWVLGGCGRPAPTETPKPSAASRAPTTADFVVCIDNSKSIAPPEQVLIREITMLLADLAAPDDRISVITFGRDARVAASAHIRSDRDRVAFKEEVRRNVSFQENFSDIRLGLKLLADKRETLFRPAGTVRAPILLSDGKLEPAEGNAAGAFQEIQETLRGPLAQTSIHAVLLGDTTSRDAFLGNVTGRMLMEQHIARSPDFFYPARSLDQLLEIAVAVLHKTKGISSLGEKGKTQFKIDNSVESMTFIVRKKSSGGGVLCRSSDIQLRRLEPQPAAVVTSASRPAGAAASVYWSSDYEYFDLIAVEKPEQGLWEIALEGGKPAEALTKIVTNVDLEFAARRSYYLNESAAVAAWLFERKSAAVSKGAYRIQAHLAAGGDLAQSNIYVPLRRDAGTGQHLMEAPGEILKAAGREGKAGAVRMELIAEDPGNPWFVRRSAPVTIAVEEPFVEWTVAGTRFTRLPFWSPRLELGAGIGRPKAARAPDFEVPPRLETVIERRENEGFRAERQATVEAVAAGGKLEYRWAGPAPSSGEYRYRYQLAGATRKGPFTIVSPWYGFRVRFPWAEIAAVFLVAVALLSRATAGLKGRLMVQLPGAAPQKVDVAGRTFDSSRIRGLKPEQLAFQLQARRLCFVKSWIVLKVTRGSATLDRRPVPAGKRIRLRPSGSHVLTSRTGAGEVSIKMNVTV